jgi:tRNA (guanine-N7-)-methyltransferase
MSAAAHDSAGADIAEDAKHRPIRSFVLRTGRTTPAQQRAFEQHWPRFGLEYSGQPRDLDASFGRQAPRVLEIGFGNGEALRYAANRERERDFIGVEVHTPGVGQLLNALAEDSLDNVRIFRHDAVEVLRDEIAPASLAEVRIYFPDPWHKKRHHKRRLIQPAFVALLASRLQEGGMLHLATDWADYAAHMIEVVEGSRMFCNLAGPGGGLARPQWRLPTRFEDRGIRLGHQVVDLVYRKV